MNTIEKRAWPEYFQKVLDGDKKFDLRVADFDIKEGDILILKEYDPKTKCYTGREISKKARFVIKTKDLNFYEQADVDKYGFQVISF